MHVNCVLKYHELIKPVRLGHVQCIWVSFLFHEKEEKCAVYLC